MLDKQTVYKKQIQKHLYFGGELSCSDLSDLTEKSIPLTSKIINELIDEGSVIESGLQIPPVAGAHKCIRLRAM